MKTTQVQVSASDIERLIECAHAASKIVTWLEYARAGKRDTKVGLKSKKLKRWCDQFERSLDRFRGGQGLTDEERISKFSEMISEVASQYRVAQ